MQPNCTDDELKILLDLEPWRQRNLIEEVLFGFRVFSDPLRETLLPIEYVKMHLGNKSFGMHLTPASECGSAAIAPISRWWNDTAAFRLFVERVGSEKDKLRLKEVVTTARIAQERAQALSGTGAALCAHIKYFLSR